MKPGTDAEREHLRAMLDARKAVHFSNLRIAAADLGSKLDPVMSPLLPTRRSFNVPRKLEQL